MLNARIVNTVANAGIRNVVPNARIKGGTPATATNITIGVGTPMGLLLALTYSADQTVSTRGGGAAPNARIVTV